MTDTQGKPSELVPCPQCNAPCHAVAHSRSGDWGWGTSDSERTTYQFFATTKESLEVGHFADVSKMIPEGFALVPIKATKEIRDALRLGSRKDYPSDEMCNVRWAAAIAARPQRKEDV